jgi:serine/threonine-protein kinase
MKVIGQGAFGSVYLAETLGRGISSKVAIKVLHPERAAEEGLVRRLRDEARMLALLRHRAIVRVDDLIELNGQWSVVMEYVEGIDVGAILKDTPLPARAALQVAEEVAHALHAAHSQLGPDRQPLRLVHRDIKPTNIRLTPAGEVKLLDFGVARAEFGQREAATTNTGFGTLIYMSPERFRGEDIIAGDVYALGVTLFEMLTGVPPGSSAGDTDRHPPGRRLVEQWRWVRQVSPALERLLLAMMAEDAPARPSPRECARQLAELRLGVGGEMLEEWAESALPGLIRRAELAEASRTTATLSIGQVLHGREPVVASRERVGTAPTPPWLRDLFGGGANAPFAWGAAIGFGLLGLVVVIFFMGALVALARSWSPASQRTVAAPTPLPAPDEPSPTPVVQAPTQPRDRGTAREEKKKESGKGAAGDAARDETPAPSGNAAKKTQAGTTAQTQGEQAADPARPPVTPAAPEPPATGQVFVVGDAESVVIRGADGPVTGRDLPPGTYRATATWASGEQAPTVTLTVEAGKTSTLHCQSSFGMCMPKAPR